MAFAVSKGQDLAPLFTTCSPVWSQWLTPPRYLELLDVCSHSWLAQQPPILPPSGTILFFNRTIVKHFRKDGHNWCKTGSGNSTANANEKLKINGAERLRVYYFRTTTNEGRCLHRRVYSILNPEKSHIVLVHYLDLLCANVAPASPIVSKLPVPKMEAVDRLHALAIPQSSSAVDDAQKPETSNFVVQDFPVKNALFDDHFERHMLDSCLKVLGPDMEIDAENSLNSANSSHKDSESALITNAQDCCCNFDFMASSSSSSSSFSSSSSSSLMRNSFDATTDMPNFAALQNNCHANDCGQLENNTDFRPLQMLSHVQQLLDENKHLQNEAVAAVAKASFDILPPSPLQFVTTPKYLQTLPRIADYSPSWDWVEGGSKIIILMGTGFAANLSQSAAYSISFGSLSTSVEVLKVDAFRCHAPPSPGNQPTVVGLNICFHGIPISQPVEFVYRQRQLSNLAEWLAVTEREFQLRVVDRLSQINQKLNQNVQQQSSVVNGNYQQHGNMFNGLQCLLQAAEYVTGQHNFLTLLYLAALKKNEVVDTFSTFEEKNFHTLMRSVVLYCSLQANGSNLLWEADDDKHLRLFHFVSFFGYHDILSVLLQLLPSPQLVNCVDKNGWTALHYSSLLENNQEVIRLLLENGADIDLENDFGYTAYDVAVNLKSSNVTTFRREIVRQHKKRLTEQILLSADSCEEGMHCLLSRALIETFCDEEENNDVTISQKEFSEDINVGQLLVIQRNVRKWIVQRQYHHIQRAIASLQAATRGHLARKEYKKVKKVCLIQKHVRIWLQHRHKLVSQKDFDSDEEALPELQHFEEGMKHDLQEELNVQTEHILCLQRNVRKWLRRKLCIHDDNEDCTFETKKDRRPSTADYTLQLDRQLHHILRVQRLVRRWLKGRQQQIASEQLDRILVIQRNVRAWLSSRHAVPLLL